MTKSSPSSKPGPGESPETGWIKEVPLQLPTIIKYEATHANQSEPNVYLAQKELWLGVKSFIRAMPKTCWALHFTQLQYDQI